MPVRNEDWIIGLSLRAALMWCDQAVVLNHASTDRTAVIVDEIADETGQVIPISVPEGQWNEMEHRQMMLDAARKADATHVAIVDADEILTGNLLPVIRTIVESTAELLQLPGYNLRGGINQYHATGVWSNRWFSVAFHDRPDLHWAGDRFHHREPMGAHLWSRRAVSHGSGGVMHLWGASEPRLVAKHRLYRVTERVRWPNKPVHEIERMYSIATDGMHPGERSHWTYAPVPDSWWQPYRHLMSQLRLDADPWQDAECERLIAQHGTDYFAGLRV